MFNKLKLYHLKMLWTLFFILKFKGICICKQNTSIKNSTFVFVFINQLKWTCEKDYGGKITNLVICISAVLYKSHKIRVIKAPEN